MSAQAPSFSAGHHGFTTIELTVVAGLLLVAAFVTLTVGASLIREAEYQRAVSNGYVLAQLADSYRKRIATSTPPAASTAATYTFRGYPNWTPAATLIADLGGGSTATVTPWGAPYEVRTTNNIAVVRFVIPAEYDPRNRVVTGNVRLTNQPGGASLMEIAPLAQPTTRLGAKARQVRAANMEEVR